VETNANASSLKFGGTFLQKTAVVGWYPCSTRERQVPLGIQVVANFSESEAEIQRSWKKGTNCLDDVRAELL
jgi:hypothetical protein